MLKKISATLLAGLMLVGSTFAQDPGLTAAIQGAIDALQGAAGAVSYDSLTPAQKRQAIAMFMATDEAGNQDAGMVSEISAALDGVNIDDASAVASAIESTSFASAPAGSDIGGPAAGPSNQGSSSNDGPSGAGSDVGGGDVDVGGFSADASDAPAVDLASIVLDAVAITLKNTPSIASTIVEEAGGSASQ